MPEPEQSDSLLRMAQNITIQLTDDLDGSKGERTVSFSLDGKSYDIDLSKKNAAALEKIFKPYLEAGRRVRSTGSKASAGRRRSETAAIRPWATASGYEFGDRGRIPVWIVEAYEAAK